MTLYVDTSALLKRYVDEHDRSRPTSRRRVGRSTRSISARLDEQDRRPHCSPSTPVKREPRQIGMSVIGA